MHRLAGCLLRPDAVITLSLTMAASLAVPLPASAQRGEFDYVEETDPLVRQPWYIPRLGQPADRIVHVDRDTA